MGSLECAKRNFPVCAVVVAPVAANWSASCHCAGIAVRLSAGKMTKLSVVNLCCVPASGLCLGMCSWFGV